MPRNRLQITAFVTSIIQIVLCVLAIWSMWDTAKTSDQFSTGALDTHFQFTQQATLLPDVLLTALACGLLCAVFWNRRPLAPWIYVALQILAILVIACVWITLSRVDFAYATFFVAQGTLAPNEIMGSSWPPYVVVLLLTAASLLGLIPLIWLLVRLGVIPTARRRHV